jgi:hypothetical protein
VAEIVPEPGAGVAKPVKKGELPTKPCAACGRPFAWRKKWAKDWDRVKYCSDRCRRAKSGVNRPE